MFQPHLVDVEQPGMAGTSFRSLRSLPHPLASLSPVRPSLSRLSPSLSPSLSPPPYLLSLSSHPRTFTNALPSRAEMLFNTIQAAPLDVRAELYKHVVLSGGSSMYPGLPSRLEKEMKQLYLSKVLGGDPERLSVSPFRSPWRREDERLAQRSFLPLFHKSSSEVELTPFSIRRNSRSESKTLLVESTWSSSAAPCLPIS